jgi:radical SAM superfamily enzyme YgiQ (UPF0313 family)
MSIQRGRLIKICREIVRRRLDIQFSSISGFHISSLDREVVEALCAAGYVHAILPVEHASDFIRNEIIGKKVSREKIFEVADLFKRKRVTTRGFFIIGFPEETEETLKETVQMIRELGLDFVNVFNLVPFPGTRVFQQCLENGLLVEDVDTRSLWRGTFNLDPTKDKGFYIKPFSLEVEDLQRYRQEIDELILKQKSGKGKNDR